MEMNVEWVPVSQRLPELGKEQHYADCHWYESEEVLGFADEGLYVVVKYTDSGDGQVAWVCSDGCEYSVSYWMNLPKPPKEVE